MTVVAAAVMVVALPLASLAASPGIASSSSGLKPVSLIVQWLPQSQFAGYYMAKEKGFYAARGLDVTILRGGPDRDEIAYLRDGRAQFATFFLTGALVYRDRGVPLIHLAQVVNRSNLLLVARADAGIDSVDDLEGRRISLWGEGFRAACLGWLHANGAAPSIVPQYYSVNLFLRRGVDACAAMYYNEYHMLYQAGVDWEDMATFAMRDEGFDFPEDGIYCLEDTFASDPDTCRACAEASLQGWEYVAANPDEALAVVMREVGVAHVPTNRAHQRWMVESIVPTIVPGPGDDWKLGELTGEDYAEAVATMQTQFLISPGATPFRLFHPSGDDL